MTEKNQKIMYDNFIRLSKEGDTEKKRKNCLGYAAKIAESFPHFDPRIEEARLKAEKEAKLKAERAEKEAKAEIKKRIESEGK